MLIGSKRGVLVSGHKLLLLFHCRDVWAFLHMFVEVWPNEGTSESRIGYCIKQRRCCASLQMILYQLTSTIQKALRPFLDATGAFFSWEVLTIALLMIKVNMPSITETIYEDNWCREADPEHATILIEVQCNTKANFLLIFIEWAVLIAMSLLVLDLALIKEGNLSLDTSKRYEHGMIMPQRTRANLSSDQSWKGALRDVNIPDSSIAVGEGLTCSPLHQHESSEEIEP